MVQEQERALLPEEESEQSVGRCPWSIQRAKRPERSLRISRLPPIAIHDGSRLPGFFGVLRTAISTVHLNRGVSREGSMAFL